MILKISQHLPGITLESFGIRKSKIHQLTKIKIFVGLTKQSAAVGNKEKARHEPEIKSKHCCGLIFREREGCFFYTI